MDRKRVQEQEKKRNRERESKDLQKHDKNYDDASYKHT